MKRKWYKVEYYTTIKPPKKDMSDLDDRYFPRGIKGRLDWIDELRVSLYPDKQDFKGVELENDRKTK